MAIPGYGARLANDVLQEVSLRLVEPIVQTTLSAPVAAGTATVAIASTEYIYVGCQLVCDVGAKAEVITVTAVAPDPTNTITAVFAFSHSSGASLTGATFPIQQPTDPIFTQSEMLGYLSRAQNEFLEQAPIAFAPFYGFAVGGTVFQSLPATAIELERVAASAMTMTVETLARAGGVVTATFPSPHGLQVGSTFTVQAQQGVGFVGYGDGGYGQGPYGGGFDPTFGGVFQVASIVSSTVLTYNQDAGDATQTLGLVTYYIRLYEVTQSEMYLTNPMWQSMPGQPTGFFQDRSGLYQFGLNAVPPYTIPLELLCSIRDTDSLTLLDGFLLPDTLVYLLCYLVLSFCLSKDGVFSDPQRAKYAHDRYLRGVMAVNRLLDHIMPSGGK